MKRVRVVPMLLWLCGSSAVVGAAPLDIPAGADNFGTDPAGTFVNLALPAGFFGPGSQPFAGQVNFTGFFGTIPAPDATLDIEIVLQGTNNAWEVTNPLLPCVTLCLHTAPQHQHQFFTAFPPDTSVQRLSSMTLPDIGSSASTAIQIIQLSLISTSVLQIDLGGGFIVPVLLFAHLTPGPQPIGLASFTRLSETGGIWDATLPIDVRFTAQIVPEPGTLLLLSSALVAIAARVRASRR